MGTSLPHFLLHQICHLDGQCFQNFLQQFSQAYPEEKHILQVDNGPLHKAKALEVPENIMLFFQPPHCQATFWGEDSPQKLAPESNPIERFWEDLKSFLHWELFSNLDELRAKVRQLLNSFITKTIASLTGWHHILQALSVAGI